MPGLLQLLTEHGEGYHIPKDGTVEEFKLWLPSTIPRDRKEGACVAGLARIESHLQTAQCHDALNDTRYMLRVKTQMVNFKHQHVHGQREGVRSRAVIDRVHERVLSAVRRYRASRKAKMELDGPGDWETALQELSDDDVRSYRDPSKVKSRNGRIGTNKDTVNGEAIIEVQSRLQDDGEEVDLYTTRTVRKGTGETRKNLLWIWTTTKTLNIDDRTDDDDQVLRAEWCKSRAQSNRSIEEVHKVQEEMRRTLKYLGWKSQW